MTIVDKSSLYYLLYFYVHKASSIIKKKSCSVKGPLFVVQSTTQRCLQKRLSWISDDGKDYVEGKGGQKGQEQNRKENRFFWKVKVDTCQGRVGDAE